MEGGHIACVYKPPSSNDLIIIELQDKRAITQEALVVGYFTKMKNCSLIVGGLTLKPPVNNYMTSNTNHRDKNMFASSIKNLPVQRHSRRLMNLRTNQEVSAINNLNEHKNKTIEKVKNILTSLKDRFSYDTVNFKIDVVNEERLKQMNDRVERALRRKMQLEDPNRSMEPHHNETSEAGHINTSTKHATSIDQDVKDVKKGVLDLLENIGKNMEIDNDNDNDNDNYISGKLNTRRKEIINRQRNLRSKPF